jgi:hypothetical protein
VGARRGEDPDDVGDVAGEAEVRVREAPLDAIPVGHALAAFLVRVGERDHGRVSHLAQRAQVFVFGHLTGAHEGDSQRSPGVLFRQRDAFEFT